MKQHTVLLSEEERQYLQSILQRERDKVRVEYRHTATDAYRDVVRNEQQLIQQLLDKLQAPVQQCTH